MKPLKVGDIVRAGNFEYVAISCDGMDEDYICNNCDMRSEKKCKEVECLTNDLYFKKKQNE